MKTLSHSTIWIAWEVHRRNRSITGKLKIPLFEFTYESKSRILRYVVCSFQTMRIVIRYRPKHLIVQNPSLVLALLSILMKHFICYTLFVDSHNAGIFPKEGSSKVLMMISRLIQKYSDLVIVTNSVLQNVIKRNGGRARVLPDALPDFPRVKSFRFRERINVAFICSYSTDEPFLEVFKAGYFLPSEVGIYVTGKPHSAINASNIPHNVHILGFVPEDEYVAIIDSCDIVMDLTFRKNCLVCGAYEGIAAQKPLILSDTIVIRETFTAGVVYVYPESRNIYHGIMEAICKYVRLKEAIMAFKDQYENEWNSLSKDIFNFI